MTGAGVDLSRLSESERAEYSLLVEKATRKEQLSPRAAAIEADTLAGLAEGLSIEEATSRARAAHQFGLVIGDRWLPISRDDANL